jgi:retinol dehydrogenase-14
MTGRVCLVTGATSGIGKATAAALASIGARVGVVARDPAKGEATLAELRASSNDDRVELFLADLSSQTQVRSLAEDVLGRYDRLQVLVNCAGGYWAHRHLTADGLELTFALNHLSYFLLTDLLLDLLIESAPSRIVNVASGAQSAGRIAFDDLQGERGYRGQAAYNQSKLANVLFTYELARRLEGTGVTANCVHPRRGQNPVRTGGPQRRLSALVGGEAFHAHAGAGRGHHRLPRVLARGAGSHRPVLGESQAEIVLQALV